MAAALSSIDEKSGESEIEAAAAWLGGISYGGDDGMTKQHHRRRRIFA